jgi:DNA invertase Pin-like site-specific DNA recombinase
MRERAAIYARFSTDLQSDRSIDDQVALCVDHARRQGMTVVATYSDRARTSASMIGREGVTEMIAAARAGKIDVVIVEALDRISRDQEDLAAIYKRCSFAGVRIEAVHDGVADVVQIGVRGLVGALYLEDLKHKVRRGMAGVIRDGRHAGGRGYGYAVVPGEVGILTIVEDEANVIRDVFVAYRDGASPRKIAGDLNARGVSPPRGARWGASTINGSADRGYGILRNPLYAGRIAWGRVRMIRDPETGKRVSRTMPPDQWQWQDAPHLRIVPESLWQTVQSRLSSRMIAHAKGGARRRMSHALSGRIRCGVCGGGMALQDHTPKGPRVRCSTARESGSCDNRKSMYLGPIEEAVWGGLRDRLAHPAYLEEYVRVYRSERSAARRAAMGDRDRLERDVATARAAHDRAVDLVVRGVIAGDDAEARIMSLREEVDRAKTALDAAGPADHVIALHPQAPGRYAAAVQALAARLGGADPDRDREVIDAARELIDHVVVWPADGGGVRVVVRGRMEAILAGDPALGLSDVAEARYGRKPQLVTLMEELVA